MRRFVRLLVVLVCLPSLVGCYRVMQAPVPPSHPEREELDLRGVVVQSVDDGDEEVVEFAQLHEATWTPSALSFVADVRQGGRMQTVTRLVPLTELQAVIVRQFDAGRTSAIVGGVIVGVIAAVAIIVTGDADSYLPG